MDLSYTIFLLARCRNLFRSDILEYAEKAIQGQETALLDIPWKVGMIRSLREEILELTRLQDESP